MAVFVFIVMVVVLQALVAAQRQSERQFVLTDPNGQPLDMSQFTMMPTFMGPFPVLTSRLNGRERFINSRQTPGSTSHRPMWIPPVSGPSQRFIQHFNNNGFQLNQHQRPPPVGPPSPNAVPIFIRDNPGRPASFNFAGQPAGMLHFHNHHNGHEAQFHNQQQQPIPQVQFQQEVTGPPASSPSPDQNPFSPEPPPISLQTRPSQFQTFNPGFGPHRLPQTTTARLVFHPQIHLQNPSPSHTQHPPVNQGGPQTSTETLWSPGFHNGQINIQPGSLEFDQGSNNKPLLLHNQFQNGFLQPQVLHHDQQNRPPSQVIEQHPVLPRPQQDRPPIHDVEQFTVPPRPQQNQPPSHVVEQLSASPRPQQNRPQIHELEQFPVSQRPQQNRNPINGEEQVSVSPRPQQDRIPIHVFEQRPVSQSPQEPRPPINAFSVSPRPQNVFQPPPINVEEQRPVSPRPQNTFQPPPINVEEQRPVSPRPQNVFLPPPIHLSEQLPISPRPQIAFQPPPNDFLRPTSASEFSTNHVNGFHNQTASFGVKPSVLINAQRPKAIENQQTPSTGNHQNFQLNPKDIIVPFRLATTSPVPERPNPTIPAQSSAEILDADQFSEMLRIRNTPKPMESTRRPSKARQPSSTSPPTHLQGPFHGTGELSIGEDQIRRPADNPPSAPRRSTVKIHRVRTSTSTPRPTAATTQQQPLSVSLQQIHAETFTLSPELPAAINFDQPPTKTRNSPPRTMSTSKSANPKVNSEARTCNPASCQLPNCFCGGNNLIPGDLNPSEVPQMVLLTFDDSINDINYDFYSSILKDRFNPNGCPISATFYVSHEWTDYAKVGRLYSLGHEIASHSISHSDGATFTKDRWIKEIDGQRRILSALGGIKLEDIKGMRAPFLQGGGNRQFRMLYESNITYDASIPSHSSTWPYTLEYRMPHECGIPPCPTRSYPGVWEIPMVMWEDLNKGRCAMADSCHNPTDARGVYDMLVKNFKRHYKSTRVPFGMYYHYAWFTKPHHREGFLSFIDALSKLPDVYFVTSSQLIDWMRQPTPLSRIAEFKPWQCQERQSGRSVASQSTCTKPKSCSYRFKGDERRIPTCQTCPEKYPWLETYHTLPIV